MCLHPSTPRGLLVSNISNCIELFLPLFETIPFPRMISANCPQRRFRKPVWCALRTVKLRFNRIIFVVLEGHFDAKGTILKNDRTYEYGRCTVLCSRGTHRAGQAQGTGAAQAGHSRQQGQHTQGGPAGDRQQQQGQGRQQQQHSTAAGRGAGRAGGRVHSTQQHTVLYRG